MLTLYITRHGETVWNTQKRIQGWKDSALTETGKQNALSLGERLTHIPFEAVYSSPSGRTKETARLICGERKIPIFYDENLREINLGDWEGETHTTIKEKYEAAYQHFWNQPHLYVPASGESFNMVQ
ncbi:histidine phosphatase family protein [Neobacillus terrae]|uniref:histidine phosphatase family protein n=1 Tax=Neobacillus terrae TaxID=3034837 RepID=UPI001407C34F|nr:histidine phosphatase family protein [Neobacillus terrae]NHM33892.1 histidine phosphatase family protein [Neobacillus terrae]